MDSNIIIHVVSDTQDAGLLVLAQVAIALGSIGTVLGAIALALIGKRRVSSKKKKEDKELDEYLKKEKGTFKPEKL